MSTKPCKRCKYEPDSCNCEWTGLSRGELLRRLRVFRSAERKLTIQRKLTNLLKHGTLRERA